MSDSDLELLTNNTPVLTFPHHPPKHFHNTTEVNLESLGYYIQTPGKNSQG